MRILLALNSSNLAGKRYCGFKGNYSGISVEPLYAGKFGWFWIKALKQMGHIVESVPISKTYVEIEHSALAGWYGVFERRSGLKALLIRKSGEILLEKIKDFNPELILIDGGAAIEAKVIKLIKEKYKAILINWLLDDPLRQEWKNVLESFPFYDHIFTFDPYYIEKYKALGAKNVDYLPCACDPDIYKTVEVAAKDQYELTFVGTITPYRKESLSGLAGFNLNIWSWKPQGLPELLRNQRYYKGKAFGEDINKIYNSSKVVLNFHHLQSIYGTNMRTFEIASSGAFQLVEYKRELVSLFKLKEELVCFHDMAELKEQIKYYLPRAEERRAIAQASQKRCQAEHTFIQRFQKMFSLLNGIK